jgi:hypothetical protein
MDTPDAAYASYGWWLRTDKDGVPKQASSFFAYTNPQPAAIDIATLRGSATYMGGAAGKYAISSLTGGLVDAGHFTADAELKATFAANTDNTNASKLSGVIDNFTGADGMSRDWMVKLEEGTLLATGVVSATVPAQVEWTIDGTAASKDGSRWEAQLFELGDDGVPAVATGAFYTTYGRTGRMVGAFGAKKQ